MDTNVIDNLPAREIIEINGRKYYYSCVDTNSNVLNGPLYTYNIYKNFLHFFWISIYSIEENNKENCILSCKSYLKNVLKNNL